MSQSTPENEQITTTSRGVEGAGAKRWGGWFYVVAAGIVGLAAVLRFLFIGKYEVWLDESYCFAVARKPIPTILSDLVWDNGPPLYYIMLHYWMRLFGESPAALRSLSAVLSVATVALVLGWKTPWFSRQARLWSGLVVAITPLAIYYGQETRMYSAVAFVVLLSMVFLERGLRVGGAVNWGLCAATTAVSLYTSYAAIFVLPAGYAVIGVGYISSRETGQLKRQVSGILAAHAAAGLLFAAWLPTFFAQPSSSAIKWIRPMWQNEPRKYLLPLVSVSTMTTGGGYYRPYLRHLALDGARIKDMRTRISEGREKRTFVKVISAIPAPATIALMAALAGAMIVAALRGGRTGFPWRTLLVSSVVSANMVPFALSFKTPMYVPGRYDLTASLGFAALSGIGLSRMSRKWRICAITVMGLLFLYTFGYMQAWPGTKKFSPKAKALTDILKKGDVVIGTSYEYGQAYYHVGPIRDELLWMTFPRETVKHFAWLDFDKWLWPNWDTADAVPRTDLWTEAKETMAEAAAKAPPGGAIALLLPGNPPPWEQQVNKTLEIACLSMIESGALIQDAEATNRDMLIWVLRRPGGAK